MVPRTFFGFHSVLVSDFEKCYNKPILSGTLASYRLLANYNEKKKRQAKMTFLYEVQHVTCYN